MSITIKHNKGTGVIPIKNTSCKALPIADILPMRPWRNHTCFLIAGGPSLAGFDFNLIKNQLSIGINKSFIKFPTTINYAMDSRFYDLVTFPENDKLQNLHEKWRQYTGIKVFLRHSLRIKFDSSVYFVPSLHTNTLSLDLKKGIWGGNNSGFGALMLAIALGSKRIGLLGYDLKIKESKDSKKNKIETHWHGGYGNSKKDTFQEKLDKFKLCFNDYADVIASQGIEVVNLNLDSALNCFPKDTLDNFLSKSGK